MERNTAMHDPETRPVWWSDHFVDGLTTLPPCCAGALPCLGGEFRRRMGYGVEVRNPSQMPAVPVLESITWDEAAWPVVRVAFRDGKEERYIWLLQKFEVLLARRQSYVLLFDTTALSTIPAAATRHTVGKWQKEHDADSKKWCLGAAIVISSRLVRGALTAMNWVHEPVSPQYYPSTRREALDWCIATADTGGLTISATARAILQSPRG